MANHKRKGPKSTRAGCLYCKPHKHQTQSQRRGDRDAIAEELDHYLNDYDSEGKPVWLNLPEFCDRPCCNDR